MSCPRLVLLTTAIGIGIATAAANAALASAETFTLSTEKCNGAVLNLCWNNGTEDLELTGKQPVTAAKTTGTANVELKGVIAAEEITIECEALKQGATGKNAITQTAPLMSTGTWALKLNFEKCTLTAPAALAKKCVVLAEKETLALTGALTSVTELKLTPEAGEAMPFIELEFKNNGTEVCPATFKAALHPISGFQVLSIINPEFAEETKSVAAVVKSGLKLAGSAAELAGDLTFSFTGLNDKVVVVKTA